MSTYFDVTDLVQYAKGHNRVSGIQRVQWRILTELAHGPDADTVQLCFYSSQRRQHLSIPATAVFSEAHAEFNAGLLLRTLGEIQPGVLPPRHEIKRLLKPYEGRKWLRGLRKGQLYLTALLQPEALLAQGVEDWRDAQPLRVARPLARPLHLQARDQLALFGAYWDHDPVIQLAMAHRRALGDVAMLVHDVIPDAAPALCTDSQVRQFRQRMALFPRVANRFLAVSRFTAQDFVQAMHGAVHLDDVQVVPLAHAFGHSPRCTHAPRLAPHTETGQRQVLCVGTIEARKNQLVLLQAWQQLIERFGEQTPELVLCGKFGSKPAAFKALLASDPALQRKVRIVSAPSDEQLGELYAQAWFTVFPSLYEGWGLPVGEAAWLGKVCLASSASSVPEVLGEAGAYLSPHHPEDWSTLIGHLITAPQLLTLWTQQALQAPLRDWSQVAQAMLDTIRHPDAPIVDEVVNATNATDRKAGWPQRLAA
jgi:glycosyltransferase involved in cell wall biosynthesis